MSPYWRHDFETGPKIGRHIFYRARTAAQRGETATMRLASRRISN